MRHSKSRSPARTQLETDPAVVPIHQANSDTDTDMDDDKTPKERAKTSGKRSIDLADDLHKAIDEARRVLSEVPCQQRRNGPHRSRSDRRGSRRCRHNQVLERSRRLLEGTERGDLRQRDEAMPGVQGDTCNVTSARSTPRKARSLVEFVPEQSPSGATDASGAANVLFGNVQEGGSERQNLWPGRESGDDTIGERGGCEPPE